MARTEKNRSADDAIGQPPLTPTGLPRALVHSLLHNNLAFHPSMAKTAGMAALKRICARRLGHEFNRGRFAFLEQPTVLRRSEN